MVNREIKVRKRAVKEEKEEIDGEIVRIRKGHPRTNLPVKLPENPTWLKQPNVVTLMAGDFKTVQIRILIAVIEKLQNVIELSIQHLDKYGTSIPCEQLSLFQEYSDRIRVDIAYRDLGVNPDQYKEVKSMVRKLISIPVEFDVKDPITGEESWSITGLFTKANIPKTPYSRGFSLEMDREVAKVFINVDRGFTRYIKEIALRAQSRYTIRMYMLISSWKEKGGFSIYVDRFRKFLKLEDKYPEFKDLYKRVIRPVYDDLFEQADCWFEMAEVYRNSGDTQPYKLNFKVIKSALSKKEEELLKGQKKMITNFCSLHFAMKDEHLQQFIPQITLSNYKAVVTKMLSYFFRLGYVLHDRYLLTATLRADGASVFARNNKWGYFPSVALGWNVNQEKFLRNVDWLSNLKLRLSWGQTGNADISTNAFASYQAANGWVGADHNPVTAVTKAKLENPDLKWETTTEWNFGLDFGFLKDRITGSVDVYQRVISDLLNYKPLNSYQEVKQIMANIGKTQSRGIEVTLNTRNIVTKDFFWGTTLTYAKYEDRWKERTPDWKPNVYESVDDPIRPIYARRADHILQVGEAPPAAQPDLLPGQIVIKDVDGYKRDSNGNPMVDEQGRFVRTGKADGIIDEADTQLIGSVDPGWMGSLTNTFRYKGFDFSFSLNGMFDRIMEDPTEMDFGLLGNNIATSGYNALKVIKNRWTPENPSVTRPSSFYNTGHNYTYGDFFYQKAWFIRLQTISLGYTLPKSWIAKAKVLSSVRLNVSANNLFIITPYKGLDPETDSYAAAYPNARTFSFGVNVSF